jgi:1A family penicillin-binding protein
MKQSRHLRKDNVRFKKLKITVFLFFTLIAATVIFFFSYLMGLNEWKKFDPKKVLEMQQTTLVYDKDSNEVKGLFDKENRVNISLSQIPKDVINAFLSIEDARFYQHHGIDIIRIAGSFIKDIRTGSMEGGSTISQQLIKNTYLTNEQTISRKLQEAIMSYQLEETYTKDQILEMYLNYVYFGHGAHGIEAAAKVYFGKSASDLTLAEGATLAATLKAPGIYAPHINMNKSVQRRNLVLSEMENYGFITEQQKKEAQKEKIVLHEAQTEKYDYGYFIDMVLNDAQDILNMDSEEILSGGYRIYTTMDAQTQANLETLYEDKSIFPPNAKDGVSPQSALIVIDTRSGGVAGVIGGREYTGRRCLNRAIQMRRQPGSAIKPVLVYAPALEKLSFTPSTLVLDEPVNYSGYAPDNFNGKFSGWVTVRDAVAKSLNVPAVKVFHTLGVQAGKLYASNVGIPFEPQDDNLSLALGGFTQGISPEQLCASYMPFSNGGYYMQPYSITKITAPDGKVLYQHKSGKYHVLSEETAFLTTSMLSSAVDYGTAKKLKMDTIELAAKTGTSGTDDIDGNKDSWVVAYNTEYAVCCWMGYDKTDAVHCLPKDITGGTYPATVVKNVFETMYKNKTAPTFQMPSTIVEAKIDLKALEDENRVMLAGSFTPEDKEKTEYFTQETVPTQYSTYWDVPEPPDDLTVTDSGNGYPLISFTPKNDDIVYKLMRRQPNSDYAFQIGEVKGKTETVSAIDYNIDIGVTYLYYVIPCHPELTLNGKPLTGPASGYVTFPDSATDDLPF